MKRLLRFICRVFLSCADEAPIPKPILRREITANELQAIILKKCPNAKIYLSYYRYRLCDIEDIEAFLDMDETNHFKYSERFTCASFAYRLKGQFSVPDWADYATGFIWTDRYTHALYCCIDANGDFWYIEPQTDRRRSDLEAWQGKEVTYISI